MASALRRHLGPLADLSLVVLEHQRRLDQADPLKKENSRLRAEAERVKQIRRAEANQKFAEFEAKKQRAERQARREKARRPT